MVEYRNELHGFLNNILPNEDMACFFEILESVEVKKSGLLFDVGQEANGMYFIVSGKMAVQKGTGFGTRKQVVALLDKGAPVGESGLLDDSLRGASVVAVEDTSLLYLTKKSFDKFCGERSGLGLIFFRWLLSRVSLRLKRSTERLAHIL